MMVSNLIHIDPDTNHFAEMSEVNLINNQISKYYAISEYNDFVNSLGKEIIALTFNIRSYRHNIDNFHTIFNGSNSYPEIIVLTETWFTDEYTEELEGYTSNHTVRDYRAGGVSIMIKNTISSHNLSSLSYASNDI